MNSFKLKTLIPFLHQNQIYPKRTKKIIPKLMGRKRKRRSSMKSKNSSHPHIPLELLAEILGRLPAKTLLKLRIVSKEWKCLIDSPNFASLHLNLCKNNRENSSFFLIEEGRSRVPFSSIRCAETFRRIRRFDMPDYFVDHREDGGNYVNGVILLRTLDADRMRVSSFTVWNPSIRKSIEINPPGRLLAQHIRVGLGYESMSYDLKVVVMVCEETPWRDCPAPNPTQVPFPNWVHVYSLKTRAWSSSKLQTQWFKSLRFEDRSVFFNGAIHWVGCDVGMVPYPLYGSHVVAFNVKNEVISTFGLPDGRAISHSRVLAIVGESLALLDLYPGYSVIWVMEKYGMCDSWVKRFTIGLEYHEFLHFNRNCELLVTVKQEGVKMYDIKSMKIKDLVKSYRDKLVFVDTFVESLLLLTDDNND